jgi:hypothetical protein
VIRTEFLNKWQQLGIGPVKSDIPVTVYSSINEARANEPFQTVWIEEVEHTGGFYYSTGVSGTDKKTPDLLACVGLLITGLSQQGDPISFLSHMDPSIVRHEDVVRRDLKLIEPYFLQESVCAGLAGGYVGQLEESERNFEEEYWSVVLLLSRLIDDFFQTGISLLHRPKMEMKKNDLYHFIDEKRCVVVEYD